MVRGGGGGGGGGTVCSTMDYSPDHLRRDSTSMFSQYDVVGYNFVLIPRTSEPDVYMYSEL